MSLYTFIIYHAGCITLSVNSEIKKGYNFMITLITLQVYPVGGVRGVNLN